MPTADDLLDTVAPANSADALLDNVRPRGADDLLDQAEGEVRDAEAFVENWRANPANQPVGPFLRPATPAERTQGDRERLAELRAEPAAPVVGITPSAPTTALKAAGGTFGNLIGSFFKGLNAVLAASSDLEREERGIIPSLSPEKQREMEQQLPLAQLGDWFQTKAQNVLAHIPEREQGTVLTGLTESIAGLAPVLTEGGAPAVFGLLKTGEVFDSAYDNAIADGKSKDEAAKLAGDKAFLSGVKEAALWEFGPKAINGFIGDRIARTAGTSAASRWLAQTAAQGTSVGGTAAATTALQNIIEGKPVGEDVAQEALAGFLLPRLLSPTSVGPPGPAEIPFAREVHDVLDRFKVQPGAKVAAEPLPPRREPLSPRRTPLREGGEPLPPEGQAPRGPLETPPLPPPVTVTPSKEEERVTDETVFNEALARQQAQIAEAEARLRAAVMPPTGEQGTAAEPLKPPASVPQTEPPPPPEPAPTAEALLDTVSPAAAVQTPGTPPPKLFAEAEAGSALARLLAKAQAAQAAAAAPPLPGPREVQISAEEAAANKRFREEEARRQAERPAAVLAPESPAGWSPPKAPPVEPVPAEEEPDVRRVSELVQEHGGIGAPPLDAALTAMRKGQSAERVVSEWSGGAGEYDALKNVLEEIAGARDAGNLSEYHRLRKAYEKLFRGDAPKGADTVLAGLHDDLQAGRKLTGGVPESEGELIERAWADATRPVTKIDRAMTALAQEAADYETFTASLNTRGNTVHSGDQPLGDVIIGKNGQRLFSPTAEGESLPPEYQDAVLRAAGIEVEHGMDASGSGELPFNNARRQQEFDPTVLRDLTAVAGHVIESGAVDFPSYAREMNRQLAGGFKEYYHAAYNQVRDFTEAAHLKARLTPREEIEHYDSSGTRIPAGPAAPPGGPDISRTVGGGGERRRPGLRVVDEGDLPAPRPIVRSGEYTGPRGAGLDETQRFATNLALTAFADGKAAFLLGDGTGVGKTGTELAIAHQTAQRTKLPSLIVTQSLPIIENRFKADAVKLGIPTGRDVQFATYTDLSTGKVPKGEFGVVIFDEAHNLKRHGSNRQLASEKVNARHKVFATATPMDSPTHAAYFLSQLTGKTRERIAAQLGYHFEEREFMGGMREFAVLDKDVSWGNVVDNIRALRNDAVKGGQFVRREYPFYGRAAMRDAPAYSPEQVKEQRDIEQYWDKQINSARSPQLRRNLSGQKTQELSRWAEIQRLPWITEAVVEDLAAGKHVVVFAEGYNPSYIKGAGKTVPGLLTELGKELDRRGIGYAKVFEDSPAEKARAAEHFQKGRAKVLLATPKSGGAGLDMDDQIGNAPRSAHSATLNFAADVFDQMLGRVSRRNTASPAEFQVWNNRESYADRRRLLVADKKLRVLRNIQAGRDLDTSEFQREAQEQEHGSAVDLSNGQSARLQSPGMVRVPAAASRQRTHEMAVAAHHGTPHEVERFSTAKIGTGEGAQVYGWGLYFAENPKVSGQYQRGLTEKEFINRVREDIDEFTSPGEAAEAIKQMPLNDGQRKLLLALEKEDWWGFDYPHQAVQAAIREPGNFAPLSPEVTDALKTFGNHYTVELNVEPEDLLDWDKPLNASEAWPTLQNIYHAKSNPNFTGEKLYRSLVHAAPGKTAEAERYASNYLKEHGIKGIRYLDQGSRVRDKYEVSREGVGKETFQVTDSADGRVVRAGFPSREAARAFADPLNASHPKTYNYVIFDDKDITITHKNGQPVAPGEVEHGMDGEFAFEPPEGVAEQSARLAKEKATATAKAQREQLAAKAAKPLVGKVGDIGQRDLLGGGDLFSREVTQPAEIEHGFSGNTTLVQAAAQDVARVRNLVAPQTAGGPARFAGNLLRELNAKMANELARADVALRKFRRDFDRTPVNTRKFKYDPTVPLPRNFAFIDAYENGNTSSLSSTDALAAAELHKLNTADLARVHALGTGALTTWYANYFPHIWDNPKLAASVFGKILGHAPLEGPKGFLKQRTHQLFVEGLRAGLKPVHDNPIDLWLLKKREIERYILAHDFVREMKAANLIKFSYAFAKRPEGWSTVDDRAFTVYGPPTVTVKEAFDAGMREATLKLLQDLGVPHERLARIGGQRWGYERETPGVPGSERIVTKFAGPDFVIWHELGHVLKNRYADLEPTLTATDTLKHELTALADLRTDATSTASFKRNVRTMDEKLAAVLQGYVHAPDLMQKTAPTVKAAFENFIKAHPELAPLNDINPTMRLGVGEAELSHGGLLKLGDYIMPEAAARVVNNFLSPGLNPHLWYRTLRQTSNLLNGVQLGLSAFHLGFTSLDAATSRLAIALEDLAHGKPLRALGALASVPVSPFTNIRAGARLRAEVLRPGTHPELADLAKALEQAGGRTGLDAFWQTQFTRRMMRAWHEGGLQWATLPLRAPLAAWEQTMRPILEYIVPRQKLGVFADMAKRELLRLGPAADEAATREALRKAWDSVDNRMGQVVYDNLFYNRAVKDVALLAFRAYGWQLGKYREGLGALQDVGFGVGRLAQGRKPEFTHRMAYALALPLMVGTIGGLLHYLMTGRKPDEAKDYFMPQTGETDRNGNPVRMNLPSYVKDAIAYSKNPVTSFQHSLNPLLGAMFELLENADFYNTEIRHPDDPLWKQGSDVALFAAKQFVPFSVSGGLKLREDAAPLWKQYAPFFGVTPVPQRLTMTPSQEYVAEQMASAFRGEPRTKEQFDRSKLIKDIVAEIKAGGSGPDWAQDLAEGLDKHTLAPNTVEIMLHRLEYNPYQFGVSHLTPYAAVKAYTLATPAEMDQIEPIILAKLARARTLWPGEKSALLDKLVAARQKVRATSNGGASGN